MDRDVDKVSEKRSAARRSALILVLTAAAIYLTFIGLTVLGRGAL